MDFKKKAGLALALAAIFTTGGANLALANQTAVTDPNSVVVGEGDTPLYNFEEQGSTGKTAAVTGALAFDGDAAFDASQKDLTIPLSTGTIDVKGAVALPYKEIDLTGTGKLTLGEAGAEAVASTVTMNKVTLSAAGAKLAAQGAGTFTVKELVSGGTAITDPITIAGSAEHSQLPTLVVDKVTFGAKNLITVGDADGAGALVMGDITALAGSVIFADPTWTDGAMGTEQYNGSDVALAYNGVNTLIDGGLVAGHNSRFSVGTADKTILDSIVKKLDAKDDAFWDGDNGTIAAFGIFKPMTLETDTALGSIYVDQSLLADTGDTKIAAAAAGTAAFADRSFFAVDMTRVTDATAALTSNEAADGFALHLGGKWYAGAGEALAEDDVNGSSATLYLANAKSGKFVLLSGLNASSKINNVADNLGTVIDGYTAAGTITDLTPEMLDGHWTGDNAFTSSDMLDITAMRLISTAEEMANLEVLVSRVADAAEVFPRLSNGMAGLVDTLYGDDNLTWDSVAGADLGKNDIYYDSTTNKNTYGLPANVKNGAPGIAFVSRATSDAFTPAEGAAIIEGAAQIAVAAGVPAITNSVAGKVSTLVVDHANMLNSAQPAYGSEPGAFGLWVTPFYGMSDVDGMDAGRFEAGYEMSYGGAAFGADYNVSEAFRLGLALNVGGGSSDSEGNGDFYKTESDFDFFGATVYGSYSNGAFGLTGDLGYTAVDNDITQDMDGRMNMGGALKSSVDSDAFTVGLTGQYRFTTASDFSVTPHLGLRYINISTDDARVKLATRETVFDVATEDQNLFQIPLGVEFSKGINTEGGWTITPSADLGVLFTAGDTDVESRAVIPGTPYRGTTSAAEVTDEVAFTGALGIKAAADNGLSLGLDYGILASGNQTDHQFSGMLRYEF